MSEAYSDHRVYEFGDFILDVDRASLYRNSEEISLRPRAFDVLCYLVDRQGRIVSRDELHDAIWGATVVTDDAVTQCLIDIRKALGDSSQSIIRTVPRRGYVFELPVAQPADSAGASGPVAEATRFRKAAYARLGQGLLAIAILALLAVWISTTNDRSIEPDTTAPVEIESAPTIAVLPFSVLSDDESQTYFADGISEEILSLLARQRGLRVIARTSSFSYRGREIDIATVADELGVSHVLEGSFRNDGGRIRIGVQLIDASTSEYLWTERFERALSASNLFAIQDEIAVAVAESLRAELPALEHSQVTSLPTDNLDALDAYFEGRAKMATRLPEQLDEASTLFEKAIQLDPDFALAHVALAYVSVLRSLHGSFPLHEAFERMKVSVDTAMAIDDRIGEAYLPLGTYLWWRFGDIQGAERAYLRGIELSPSYAEIYMWYADLLAYVLMRPHDALPYSRISAALDPRSAVILASDAKVLAQAGQLDKAFEQVNRAIETDRSLAFGYLVKGEFLRFYKADLAGAIPLYEQAYRNAPTSGLIVKNLASAYIDVGDFERAEAMIIAAMDLAPEQSFNLERAMLQILKGERAKAVESALAFVEYSQGQPWVLEILRDQYMANREYAQAVELYRRFYPTLFGEAPESVELVGWDYPVAVDLSVLLIEIGRTEFAHMLLAAALGEAERRQQQGIGPPDIALARIHALRGDTGAAIDALQDAVGNGWRAGWATGWRLALYHDRALDSLRDLPEFQSIVAHIAADMEQQRRDLESRSSPADTQRP